MFDEDSDGSLLGRTSFMDSQTDTAYSMSKSQRHSRRASAPAELLGGHIVTGSLDQDIASGGDVQVHDIDNAPLDPALSPEPGRPPKPPSQFTSSNQYPSFSPNARTEDSQGKEPGDVTPVNLSPIGPSTASPSAFSPLTRSVLKLNETSSNNNDTDMFTALHRDSVSLISSDCPKVITAIKDAARKQAKGAVFSVKVDVSKSSILGMFKLMLLSYSLH